MGCLSATTTYGDPVTFASRHPTTGLWSYTTRWDATDGRSVASALTYKMPEAEAIYLVAKFYGVLASRFTPSFWQNVLITLFILIGPAVGDTESGKDPYKASAVRLALFVGVTIYAWLMLVLLEWLRTRQSNKRRTVSATEIS